MKRISIKDQKLIIKLYLSGKRNKALSEQFNVNRTTILNILVRNNIERRSISVSARKYKILNYNGLINNNNDAYILGLIYSDGNLYKNIIEITLHHKDKQILDDISKYVYGKIFLKIRPSRVTIRNNIKWNGASQYRLFIHAKEIADNLRSIGLCEKKSLISRHPKLEDKYISHFIRGLFDGDGCLHISKIKNGNIYANITANHLFCNDLQKIIMDHLDINVTINKATKNVSRVIITGRHQVTKFTNWIYENADLKLNRKYNKSLKLNIK